MDNSADMIIMAKKFKKIFIFILLTLSCVLMLLLEVRDCLAKKDINAKLMVDGHAVETYKKLHSKDIILNIEKGTVYLMVGRNRWDVAHNNLKLVTGDKLKVMPGTIAVINFYDEFDINLPESEMTTIEPAGITQLINEALFRTTYKDGTYVSDVVYEASKLAQYKFRGMPVNRDLKLEYCKNKIAGKTNSELLEQNRQIREKNIKLRGRVMQARNFGNGFTLDYDNAERKIINDNRIFTFEREKQLIEREIFEKMSRTANLRMIIAARAASGVTAAAEEAELEALNALLRDCTQKLEYINSSLRNINEQQNKLKLKPLSREW